MKKRSVIATVAIAAMTVSLAACSNPGGSADNGSGDGATITYWATNQANSLEDDKNILTPFLDEFTEQTGINVDLEVIGWDTVQTRIQTAAASGQAPDVTNIGNSWAASFQATGAFLPFGPSEMEAIGGADKFVTSALDTGGATGTDPTSIPIYGNVYVMYYNKAMFADAGLTPPQTYEEMISAAKQLTDPSNGVYGLGIAGGSYTENIHFAFINASQNDADFFDSNGDPTFVSDGTIEGIKRYLDLMQTDKVVNPTNAEYDDSTKQAADFANGKIAMFISQSDGFSTLASLGMSKDDYAVVAYPSPKDAAKEVSTFIAGINISIFENSKNKEAALKFVNYLTSESVQEELNEAYASLPILKGLAPKLPDTVPAGSDKVLEDIFMNSAKPLPVVPAEAAFETAVGKAMNNMFATIATGGTVTEADIKQALQDSEDQVKQSVG